MKFFLLATLIFTGTGTPAYSQPSGPVIIRDTEIEATLRQWTEPVIKAAGLVPENVNFIIIQNNNLNAFVAGGANIFIYTGILTKSDNPGEVIGVIAHELGHIRGGHLVRARDAYNNASYESMLGTILGLGAAILTGESGAAAAISAGTQSMAARKFLSFSRVQESSADQAALTYLENARLSPAGLVSFMKKLESQELLPASQQSEYVQTHPLTHNRVDALEAGLTKSSYQDGAYPDKWGEQHRRMIAKLTGFISPERVNWDYDSRDHSIAALYARAIAAYRQNRVEEALNRIDQLLVQEPDNPFFLELKGQMQVDFARIEQALPPYKKSLELYPDAPLTRIAYAHALIESAGQKRTDRLEEAIGQLDRARTKESRSTRLFRLLATAHGKLGHDAVARVYLAEEALLKGDYAYARQQAESAQHSLSENSPAWLRAQDILSAIEQREDTGKEKKNRG